MNTYMITARFKDSTSVLTQFIEEVSPICALSTMIDQMNERNKTLNTSEQFYEVNIRLTCAETASEASGVKSSLTELRHKYNSPDNLESIQINGVPIHGH